MGFDIAQIIIGVLSLAATIAVSVSIYCLQSRHEKEVRKLEENRRNDAIIEAAKVFIIDNQDEIYYLPLCVIAASVNKYKMHHRSIYTRFNKCSDEVQKEILRQENIPIGVSPDNQWIDEFIDKFRDEVKKYKLGCDYLYEDVKYFHNSFIQFQDHKIENPNPSINIESSLSKDKESKTIFLLPYIDSYLNYVLNDDRTDVINIVDELSQMPPFDLVAKTQNFDWCDVKIICFWNMLLIKYSCISFFRHNLVVNRKAQWRQVNIGSAQVETYEDMYYDTLLTLFTTYSQSSYKE